MSFIGYKEFEFDLPGALLKKLLEEFDAVTAVPLDDAHLASIPEEQGVYELFLDTGGVQQLVYVGKTDAEAGLHNRLTRHSKKIHHRVGLNPTSVYFKAIRVFVFTAMDLEKDLIEASGGTKTVLWNGSGFGSNDPGKERDTTTYKAEHFDTQFPIDIGRTLAFTVPSPALAADVLRTLKAQLPYLIRFQRLGKGKKAAHADLEATTVTIPPTDDTPEKVLNSVVAQLPTGWHATLLPSHVIVYKNDNRSFPSGRLLNKSPGTP